MLEKIHPAVNVDDFKAPAQGAVLNPFAQVGATLKELVKPVNPALFKMDEEGNLSVALGNKAVRYDATAGTAVDVTGTVLSIPGNAILAIPGTKLEPGDLFVNNDVVFQAIEDDGKTVKAYNFAESKIETLCPTVLAICPDLRDIQKVIFVYKEIFDDALEGIIMGSLMSGKAIDFQALLQGRLVKSAKFGGGSDISKFALFSMLGQQGGAEGANMLPMLFLLGKDKAKDDDMKTLMLISTLGQQGGNTNMQSLLPLLFLGGEGKKGSLLPLVMCMGMFGQQSGDATANPLQAILPLALLRKGKTEGGVAGGLGGLTKDPLLFMAMMGGFGGAQAGNNMLPMLLLLKGGLFGEETAPAAPAEPAAPADPQA